MQKANTSQGSFPAISSERILPKYLVSVKDVNGLPYHEQNGYMWILSGPSDNEYILYAGSVLSESLVLTEEWGVAQGG